MAALDTNVLVRYIIKDDARQWLAARRLFQACIDEGQALYVPVTVSIELEWVLRSNFGFGKPELIDIFSRLLSTTEICFDSEGALEHALAAYSTSAADFADCLHVALAALAGESPLWTFDKSASKVNGALHLV
jgi:predicted nucleic-acid-binding protein